MPSAEPVDDPTPPPPETATTDGRRARRERGRQAVVDALFALTNEGHLPPSVRQLAERSGVSVASVFRYFQNLDELQQEMIDRYRERYAALFEIPDQGEGTFDDRVERFVDTRLTLFETVTGPARMVRIRAREHPKLGEALADMRSLLASQVREHFAGELAALPTAEADDIAGLVDTLASFESWELLRGTHCRSRAQVRRAWLLSTTRLLGERERDYSPSR